MARIEQFLVQSPATEPSLLRFRISMGLESGYAPTASRNHCRSTPA